MTFNIDVRPIFLQTKEKIRHELVNYLQTRWVDLDIDIEDRDYDTTFMIYIGYETGYEIEEREDSIYGTYQLDETDVNYKLIFLYNNVHHEITSWADVDRVLNLLIDNVKKNIISATPEWLLEILQSFENSSEFITPVVANKKPDLN
jgi:hypothetical protein